MNNIYLSIIVMATLAALLATILSFAYSKLKIEEDSKISEVEKLLPGLNCGACGCANCYEFAKKLLNKEISIEKCRITARNKKAIEEINQIINK